MLKQNGAVPPNLAKGVKGETRQAVADLAGVSHGTLDKVERIEREGIPEVREKARRGAISPL